MNSLRRAMIALISPSSLPSSVRALPAAVSSSPATTSSTRATSSMLSPLPESSARVSPADCPAS